MKKKTAESIVATFPLLLGLGLGFQRSWRLNWRATMVLVLGALGSCILYVVFYIPHVRNEYKFIFTAAICLAPFPSLALETSMNRLGRRAAVVFACITVILAAPAAHKIFKQWPWIPVDHPVADAAIFDLRLNGEERLAGLFNAIRERTPTNSILVLESADLHFPTLTRRRLYVAPAQGKPHPGVNVPSDLILKKVKGYDPKLIEDRRATIKQLFDPLDENRRAESLDQIQVLKRPVAIILNDRRHRHLAEWLVREGKGMSLYQGEGVTLWLVKPRTGIYAKEGIK
jgi:hypothetical protein